MNLDFSNGVLLDYLRGLTPVSAQFAAALSDKVNPERYLAHQVIHAAGQRETRMWFVASGLLRQYYFDAAGREHTIGFFRECELLFSICGPEGGSGAYYVECLENTVLLSMPYRALDKGLSAYPETRILAGKFFRLYHDREGLIRDILLLSAPERYLLVRRQQNWLFSRVSVKVMATYLNMTRENLSRLMARDH